MVFGGRQYYLNQVLAASVPHRCPPVPKQPSANQDRYKQFQLYVKIRLTDQLARRYLRQPVWLWLEVGAGLRLSQYFHVALVKFLVYLHFQLFPAKRQPSRQFSATALGIFFGRSLLVHRTQQTGAGLQPHATGCRLIGWGLGF